MSCLLTRAMADGSFGPMSVGEAPVDVKRWMPSLRPEVAKARERIGAVPLQHTGHSIGHSDGSSSPETGLADQEVRVSFRGGSWRQRIRQLGN